MRRFQMLILSIWKHEHVGISLISSRGANFCGKLGFGTVRVATVAGNGSLKYSRHGDILRLYYLSQFVESLLMTKSNMGTLALLPSG
jgi:hypothetical protein